MAKSDTSGLMQRIYTRVDGTVVTYYYDRKTGKALGTDLAAARARVQEFADVKELPTGSIAALIAAYKASPKWLKLAPKSQRDYNRYLDLIREEYGDLLASEFRPEHVGLIQSAYADRPRTANYIVQVLRLLFSLAVKQSQTFGMLANPVAKPDMLPTHAREQLWSRDDQADYLAASDERVHLGFMLMLYTAQRMSDVLAMKRAQVLERKGRLLIQLRQQKTKTLVAVPVHRDLEPLVRQRLADPTGGDWLVPSPTGLRWSARNFSRKWDTGMRRMALRRARGLFRAGLTKGQVRAKLAEQHRQRRDLRRTAIVRMAELGLTTPQIAAISGHEIDYCQRIIDTYLPRRTEVAVSAMAAWEAAEAGDHDMVNVLDLAAERRRRRS